MVGKVATTAGVTHGKARVSAASGKRVVRQPTGTCACCACHTNCAWLHVVEYSWTTCEFTQVDTIPLGCSSGVLAELPPVIVDGVEIGPYTDSNEWVRYWQSWSDDLLDPLLTSAEGRASRARWYWLTFTASDNSVCADQVAPAFPATDQPALDAFVDQTDQLGFFDSISFSASCDCATGDYESRVYTPTAAANDFFRYLAYSVNVPGTAHPTWVAVESIDAGGARAGDFAGQVTSGDACCGLPLGFVFGSGRQYRHSDQALALAPSQSFGIVVRSGCVSIADVRAELGI